MNRLAAIFSVMLAMLLMGKFAEAQIPTAEEQRVRLRAANNDAKAALAKSRELEQAAETARSDAEKARAKEAAAAARIKAAEADVAAARAQVGIVDRQLEDKRVALAERQGPIQRLIAALQSMARRPPLLGLVQPGSARDMVHIRAVLGTTMPIVEQRTRSVRAELAQIRQLRADAVVAVSSFQDARKRIEVERIALVKLESSHRSRSTALSRTAVLEADRAIALGEEARGIAEQLQLASSSASLVEDLSALPGPLLRPEGSAARGDSANFRPPAYQLPVAGQLIFGLGELSDAGVRARGITLATKPGADIVAPADGRIAFAGIFRGYGQVVIVDHGGGWTSLVTGLGSLRVTQGDVVSKADPLGKAPDAAAPRITVELRRKGQPIDVAQLLD